MLSGTVPRRTVYGHLGWRRIGDGWAFLHPGGAISPDGVLEGVEVDIRTDGFLPYQLPALPAASELVAAVRASLALLGLGPDIITAAVLGAVYRAPLGEPSPIDFSLHPCGPTGAFKTELAALAQAHFGAAFHGRRLPASWADTANMLEKKAFLAKDAVLVVDDFAPVGTTADIQRLPSDRVAQAEAIADMTARPSAFSITTGEVRPRSLLGSFDASVRGYHGAEKQRGAPRITSSGPQALVARAHGEHDGCRGTGIWGIPAKLRSVGS